MAKSGPTIGQTFGMDRINAGRLGPGPKLVFINNLGKPALVFLEPFGVPLVEALPHGATINVEFVGADEIQPVIEIDQSGLTIYDNDFVTTDDYVWEVSMPKKAARVLD